MRVLVCGSRDWNDRDILERVLDGVTRNMLGITIIQGGATGADRHARDWTITRGAHCEPYTADWQRHGKAAGPLRNQRMLEDGKPDVVWAFVTKPLEESRGTADMIRRAKAAGIPAYVVSRA